MFFEQGFITIVYRPFLRFRVLYYIYNFSANNTCFLLKYSCIQTSDGHIFVNQQGKFN